MCNKEHETEKTENQNCLMSLLSVASGNKCFSSRKRKSSRVPESLRRCVAIALQPRAPPDLLHDVVPGRVCLKDSVCRAVWRPRCKAIKSETNASASRVSPANQCTEDSPSSWMTSACARSIPIRQRHVPLHRARAPSTLARTRPVDAALLREALSMVSLSTVFT